MHELAPLIYDLAVMLGLAGIVALLFQRIHQPVVLGYLIAGMIIGPHTPPYAFVSDIKNIQTLSELGVIFLMFSLGLEFSFQKLIKVGFSASVTGIVEVVLMVAIGYGVGLLMGWSQYDSLFLGAALAISSTTIIIKAIEELGLKTKRFAELIFGVLIVEDLLAILLLVALSTIVATNNIFSIDIVNAFFKLILVVGGWFLVGYFMVPPLFKRIAKYISEETLTIISVALCLFLVCIAAYFHYSAALGAFIMGSILAETILVHRIEGLIKPIRDIFAAVFFVSVGMLIDPVIIVNHWPAVLCIAIVTVVAKIITTTLGAFLTGQSVNTSVRAGFSMAQIGEFSFIIVALGASLKVTSNTLYPLIVAVSSVTTFTTPYLIRLSANVSSIIERNLPKRTKYFLDSYSAWIYRTQTISETNSILSRIAMRLLINGLIIVMIFTMVHYGMFHYLKVMRENSWSANVLLLFVTLLIASPFIWGMLFSYRRGHAKLPIYTTTTQNPLVYIISFLTLAEIAVLSIIYFHAWFTTAFFVCFTVIFLALSYKQLEKSYHWFEQQLMTNLKLHQTGSEIKYDDLAPWDTHLVEVEVAEGSLLLNQIFLDKKLWQKFQITLVAILRGRKEIIHHDKHEKLEVGDRLIFVGQDDRIDAFQQAYGIKYISRGSSKDLGRFVLKSIVLSKDHPYVGKSIKSLALHEKLHGVLVGLERHNERIYHPDPDTILKEDDLLMIVGEAEKMKQVR